MPYSIKKQGKHFTVVNKDTGKVHAKHTTLDKAKAQIRLLHSLEKNSMNK